MLTLSNITKIPSIAEAVFNNVKTDLTAGELLWMGMQALQIDNSKIQFFTLPGYGAMSTAGTFHGILVLLPVFMTRRLSWSTSISIHMKRTSPLSIW